MTLFENLLPDRFEVLGELGRGGTSVVFHARDKNRDQEVAVKILLKDTEEDRFQREAERLADLSHPNVVTFLEVGRHEERDFLVMEYLEMGDLFSFVQKLSVIKTLRLFCQICDGLAHLHDRGIVHRDIKPANILVGKSGIPKITDLGVARQMERNTRLTQAGTILGTYSYLAPEQILSSSVGPRADLYSLGICLFTSLTGRKPFEADNEFNMLKAHLEQAPPSLLEHLPSAPQSLDELVQKMLAKSEDDRPRSARAVADMLQDSIREMEDNNQQDMLPAWDEKIDELPEDQRSVLLAVSYLGKEATFENVCTATPFSEDKTDRCLEALIQNDLLNSPSEDKFSLTFPEKTIETRLTPRLRKLFATRLSGSTTSLEGVEGQTEPETPPAGIMDEPTHIGANLQVASLEVAADPEPKDDPVEIGDSAAVEPEENPEKSTAGLESTLEVEAQTKEVLKSEPDTTQAQVDAAPVAPPSTQTTVKSEIPTAQSEPKKPKWFLVSLSMILVGILMAAGGYWYWAHSAGLTVQSQPSGATVIVNGHEVGVTPLELSQLHPGHHAVALEMEGHKRAKETFNLSFREQRELNFAMKPLVGHLFLTISPMDALVTIDGKEYGKVDSELVLSKGKHKLEAKKTGYENLLSEFVLVEDHPLELELSLVQILTQIKIVSTPPGASVSLDGEKKGKTPITLEKIPFGKHDIAVRLKGHAKYSKLVEVKSAEAVELNAALKELPGDLVVTSEPSGAKFKINGEPKGNTPQVITGLKVGQYTVTVNKDGYYLREEKKNVEAGEKTEAHFDLSAIVVAPPPSPPAYRPPPTSVRPRPVYRPQPQPVRPRPQPVRPRPQPVQPPPSSNPWRIE